MKIVIIGGGGAPAVAAAETARAQNADAAIEMYSAEDYLPYMRPRLSKGVISGLDINAILIKPRSWYADKRITVHLGARVDAILPALRRVRVGDAFPRYDALVIATGAAPALPPIHSPADALLALRGYDGMERIRAAIRGGGALSVIGGGVLGLELAWDARAACATAVLEKQPWLLPRQLTEAASAIVAERFAEAGVRIVTGADDEAISAAPGVVVAAAGVRARTRLAHEAGLATGQRGITVDERMCTSDPHIYAAGDCMEYGGAATGFWQVAMASGGVAGANAAGGKRAFASKAPSALMRVGALDILSAGDIGGTLRHVSARGENAYVELCIGDGALCGGILIGDTRKGTALIAAVNERRRVTDAGALEILSAL